MNRQKHFPFVYLLLTPLLISMLLSTGAAQAAGSWKIIPGANPSTYYNNLFGVAAISANDVWAAGAYSKTQNTHQPLIEHWNGTTWSVVPSPSPSPNANLLTGVAATSTQDVWAVGNYFSTKKGASQTLIEHWNGTKWALVPSPNPGSIANILNGVIAITASNAWAVGQYIANNSGQSQTLIEHWNGSEWALVPSPNPGSGSAILLGVAASSSNRIWAVGYSTDSKGNIQTLTEYWNGTKWAVVPSPNPGIASLDAVAVISASDVWAVGRYEANSHFYSLIEHWNGSQWSLISSPKLSAIDINLYGVAAVSAHNIWAVGSYDQGSGAQTLTENWNGTQWSVVPSPNKGSRENDLFGVTHVPSTPKVWATGYYLTGSLSHTLIEFHP